MPTGIYDRKLGEGHHNWKLDGYERIDTDGRTMIKIGKKFLKKSKYVFLKENTKGMYSIPSGWLIHHINGNLDDDRVENLICLPRSYHISLHNNIQLMQNPNRKYFGKNQNKIIGGG